MSIDIGKLKHTLCATHISVQSRVYYEGEEISLCKMPLDDLKPKREWQGLTDEEIDDIQYSLDTAIEYDLFDEGEYGTEINIHPEKFARAIEAKLKEKNSG